MKEKVSSQPGIEEHASHKLDNAASCGSEARGNCVASHDPVAGALRTNQRTTSPCSQEGKFLGSIGKMLGGALSAVGSALGFSMGGAASPNPFASLSHVGKYPLPIKPKGPNDGVKAAADAKIASWGLNQWNS